jgi:glycerol-3-phosphate acyltransferase PlsY
VGALFAYDPLILMWLVGVFLPIILILRNFTLSGMIAFALAPLAIFLWGLDKVEVAAMSILAMLVLVTHRRNIREEISRITGHGPVKESPIQMHKGPNEEG